MAGTIQKAITSTLAPKPALTESYQVTQEGEEDEKKVTSDPYAPVVTKAGTVDMSPREKELYDVKIAAAGTSPTKVQQIFAERRKKEEEYKQLTDKADAKVREQFAKEQGRGRLDFEAYSAYRKTPAYQEALKTVSASLLEGKKLPLAQPEPSIPVPTIEPIEVFEGEKAKEEPKPAPVAPPSAPEGGVLAATAQPSAPAIDTTTLKEPTKEVAKSQQALPDVISSVIADRKRIAAAFGGGKPVSREATKTALENIAKVDDEIKTLYANKPPPQLADVSRARRDALQAYKEKANLNEWLSIADRAINAIASFASAQAAKGTPYVGTYKPSFTDYESRTAQALREYQAEAGLLQEERQESEKALAAYEKEKETATEQLRRGRELEYRIAQEGVKAEEEAQDRADKLTQDVFSASIGLQKNQQDINAAIEKYRTSQAKDDKEGQQKATKNVLELQIKEQENAQRVAQNLLDASNALAANPADEKAQLKYLEVTGQSAEAFEQEKGKQPGGFFGRDIVRTENLGKATAGNAQMILDRAKQRSAELNQSLQSLLAGGTVAPTPTPAPSPGQQPATGVKQFKESDIDAGITAGKYPGLTKDEVLRKFKDAGYSVLIGQ